MIISISAKCSDLFSMSITDGEKTIVDSYDGYVPAFMPGEHYGDYVILDIDSKTGQILNWRKNAERNIASFIKNLENKNE